MAGDYPSTVMFADLKKLGVSHVDTARMLFDVNYNYGGSLVGERLGKRTELSRFFIHVEPGTYSRRFFNDFGQSTQNICARLKSKSKVSREKNVTQLLIEHFRGEAATEMQEALESCNIESAPYANALERVDASDQLEDNNRLLLYLMLFLVTGCLGDAEEGAHEVDAFTQTFLGTQVGTVMAQTGAAFDDIVEDDIEEDYAIGIIRVFDGMTMRADHGLHVLPETAEGATIGSAGCDITDVDAQVSRRHARIWKDAHGWFIEGLGSTNGVVVISGADKSVNVVEPPKSKRPRGFKSQPYPIEPADTICLGQTTRFLVQMVSA